MANNQARHDEIIEFFKNANPLPPATELLGFKLIQIDLDEKRLEASFTIKPEFLNPHGSVQGGLVTGFLDEVMSGALFMATDLKAATPTLEMKTSFLRPLTTQTARAVGRVVRQGSAFGFTSGELFNSDDVLCATATATSIIRPFASE